MSINISEEAISTKIVDTITPAQIEPQEAILQNVKWQIGWGVTHKCNMSCRFCYSSKARKNSSCISLNSLINFVKNNSSYIDAINYGTGENSLSPIWFELIKYVRSNFPDIGQALTTNGFISQKVNNNKDLYDIVSTSIDEIDVSLDFADKNKHNNIRGHHNAYPWALGTLKFCKEVGIKSTIVVVGIDDTFTKENLRGIFKIAKEYNSLVRLNIYRPTNPNLNPPKTQTVFEILSWLIETYKVEVLSDPLFSSIFYKNGVVEDYSGKNSLRILHDGWITPSTYLVTNDWKSGHIEQGNILRVIKNKSQFKMIGKEVIPKKCITCKLRNRCKGGAKDRRVLYYGSLEEQDPYCPFRKNNIININDLPKITYTNGSRVSIHDGYLPTLIFSP